MWSRIIKVKMVNLGLSLAKISNNITTANYANMKCKKLALFLTMILQINYIE